MYLWLVSLLWVRLFCLFGSALFESLGGVHAHLRPHPLEYYLTTAFPCREPTGRGCLITIPELKVSKLHAAISYDRHEGSFLVEDLGSVNGTYLNRDQRLSEVGCICVERVAAWASCSSLELCNW